MNATSLWMWAGFLALVIFILILDLFVVSKHDEEIPAKKALILTACFAALGALFSIFVYFAYQNGWMPASMTSDGRPRDGLAAWTEYISVWLLEYSMSIDNLFVFTIVFTHFNIPSKYQHRVLFWGIIGALVFRGIMIFSASFIAQHFQPVLILFGLILLWTAIKMLRSGEEKFDPSKSIAIKLARLFFPVTDKLHGQRFFVKSTELTVPEAVRGHAVGEPALPKPGKVITYATPMFLVLCVIEATDILFAVDSVPAAISITKEQFIIFTANVFAILGLRSLYFAISSLIRAFRFLKYALAVVLLFIGVKLMLTPPLSFIKTGGLDEAGNPNTWHGWHSHPALSLGVIGGLLAIGVVASLIFPATPAEHAARAADETAKHPNPSDRDPNAIL